MAQTPGCHLDGDPAIETTKLLPSTLNPRIAIIGYPRHSMYGIFTYIGVVWGVNVGIYGIHGVPGNSGY